MQAYIFLETNKKCLYEYYGYSEYDKIEIFTIIDFIHDLFITQDTFKRANSCWHRQFSISEKKLISIYDIHIERDLV